MATVGVAAIVGKGKGRGRRRERGREGSEKNKRDRGWPAIGDIITYETGPPPLRFGLLVSRCKHARFLFL